MKDNLGLAKPRPNWVSGVERIHYRLVVLQKELVQRFVVELAFKTISLSFPRERQTDQKSARRSTLALFRHATASDQPVFFPDPGRVLVQALGDLGRRR